MITLKLKIGKAVIEYQAEKMESIHKFSNVWGGVPDKCSCGSDNIYPSFMETKEGYRYCKIKCKDCSATYTIKQTKNGDYFLDPKEKFEVYQKEQGSQSGAPQSEDDIPF